MDPIKDLDDYIKKAKGPKEFAVDLCELLGIVKPRDRDLVLQAFTEQAEQFIEANKLVRKAIDDLRNDIPSASAP